MRKASNMTYCARQGSGQAARLEFFLHGCFEEVMDGRRSIDSKIIEQVFVLLRLSSSRKICLGPPVRKNTLMALQLNCPRGSPESSGVGSGRDVQTGLLTIALCCELRGWHVPVALEGPTTVEPIDPLGGSRPCARSSGSSMPSGPSRVPLRSSPICPVVPTASPSPTAASSPMTSAASRSAGRTAGRRAAPATKP